MKFSLNFIREFLKVSTDPRRLARLLTLCGMEVEGLERKGNDWVFSIEVTANRYDWLSMVGIAKEIAAVSGRKLHFKYPSIKKEVVLKEKKIVIADRRDCPYYVGRMITGVKVTASAGRLKQQVVNCGVNAVNNIVDITNYAMLKWGNPLHAFDSDKIEGDIYVRRARPGENFLGIDGKERILEKSNLVIADAKKVIALAGVMGAKNTEVDNATRNIFLEAAVFSPLAVRRSRRSVGLDTESSYRFERMVSPQYLEYASQEAAKLIAETAGGKRSGRGQAGKKPFASGKKIAVHLNELNSYLGADFTAAAVKETLNSLGFSVRKLTAQRLEVSVDPQRFDLKREVDIYEEFCRIYGYEKIRPAIPCLTGRRAKKSSGAAKDIYNFKNRLGDFVALLGFREITTYSLDREEDLAGFSGAEIIKVLNPLRSQEDALRPGLVLGMIKSLRHNLNRNQECLRFFEIADIYFKKESGFLEQPVLALGAAGSAADFFLLKGAMQEIFNFLDINSAELVPLEKKLPPGFGSALEARVKGRPAGFLGKLSKAAKKNFDLKKDLFFGQLALPLLAAAAGAKQYQPFSLYPVVWRDISIALSKDVQFTAVEKLIREGNAYFCGLRIIDFYKGEDRLTGTGVFTLRIFYQSDQKTLTSDQVDEFHNRIRDKLKQLSGLELR